MIFHPCSIQEKSSPASAQERRGIRVMNYTTSYHVASPSFTSDFVQTLAPSYFSFTFVTYTFTLVLSHTLLYYIVQFMNLHGSSLYKNPRKYWPSTGLLKHHAFASRCSAEAFRIYGTFLCHIGVTIHSVDLLAATSVVFMQVAGQNKQYVPYEQRPRHCRPNMRMIVPHLVLCLPWQI